MTAKWSVCNVSSPPDQCLYSTVSLVKTIPYCWKWDSYSSLPLTDLTCPELTVESNVVLVSTNELQGWGRKLVYECASGYSLSDNMPKRVRTCEMDGTWSGEAPVCLGKSTAALSIG